VLGYTYKTVYRPACDRACGVRLPKYWYQSAKAGAYHAKLHAEQTGHVCGIFVEKQEVRQVVRTINDHIGEREYLSIEEIEATE
jgi:hypothetical protein